MRRHNAVNAITRKKESVKRKLKLTSGKKKKNLRKNKKYMHTIKQNYSGGLYWGLLSMIISNNTFFK